MCDPGSTVKTLSFGSITDIKKYVLVVSYLRPILIEFKFSQGGGGYEVSPSVTPGVLCLLCSMSLLARVSFCCSGR